MSTAEVTPQAAVPEGRRFWVEPPMVKTTIHGLPCPRWNVAQVAEMFFGLSGSWLRLRLNPSSGHPRGSFILDGEPLKFRRSASGHRVFGLDDIEPMAWALFSEGTITMQRVVCAVEAAKWVARAQGILPIGE